MNSEERAAWLAGLKVGDEVFVAVLAEAEQQTKETT